MLLVDQLQLRLETHNPSIIVIGSKFLGMLLTSLLASLLQSLREIEHRWFELLICKPFSHDRYLRLTLSNLGTRSWCSRLRRLLLLTRWLSFSWFWVFLSRFCCFGWLTPNGGYWRNFLTFGWHINSAPNLTDRFALPTCIFGLLLLLFLWFFHILLCGALWLHNVVDQVVNVLLVDLFIGSLDFFIFIFRSLKVVCVFATCFSLAMLFGSIVIAEVVSSYTSAHAASSDSAFLMSFELLTIVVIITADRVLLRFLLLLVIDLLVKGTWLCLCVCFLLLFFALKLLDTFCLNLLLGIFVEINVKVSLALEWLIRIGDKLSLFFYFSNLLKVAFEILAGTSSINPFLGFLCNLLDDIKFDDFSDVGAVVVALEYSKLRVIL